MTFEEALRSYLSRLAKRGTRVPVDVDRLRVHLMARLRDPGRHASWVQETHSKWSQEIDRLAAFIEIDEGYLVAAEAGRGYALAASAVDAAIDALPDDTPAVESLEARRIAGAFQQELAHDVHRYVLETRLAALDEHLKTRITRLGEILLRLRGRDAMRWLLTLELLQTTGDWDEWRASRRLLEETLHGAAALIHDDDGVPYFSFAERSLNRLKSLGVLRRSRQRGNDRVYEYAVVPEMTAAVYEALEESPWKVQVQALLADDQSFIGAAGAGPGAVEAVSQQAQLITHEVRNALIPVRHDVDAILASANEPASLSRLQAIRRGVGRVLDFIEQMVTATEIVKEPPVTFILAEAVREAVEWAGASNKVEYETVDSTVHVRGPRAHLSRVVLQLITNALQATPPQGHIRLSIVRRLPGRGFIEVDDSGPGVAAELRDRIFHEGFTTKPAGTGFGLSFARRVVESEFSGKIRVADSELGGAQFVVELPEEVES